MGFWGEEQTVPSAHAARPTQHLAEQSHNGQRAQYQGRIIVETGLGWGGGRTGWALWAPNQGNPNPMLRTHLRISKQIPLAEEFCPNFPKNETAQGEGNWQVFN